MGYLGRFWIFLRPCFTQIQGLRSSRSQRSEGLFEWRIFTELQIRASPRWVVMPTTPTTKLTWRWSMVKHLSLRIQGWDTDTPLSHETWPTPPAFDDCPIGDFGGSHVWLPQGVCKYKCTDIDLIIPTDWKLECHFAGKTWISRKNPRTTWEIREAF